MACSGFEIFDFSQLLFHLFLVSSGDFCLSSICHVFNKDDVDWLTILSAFLYLDCAENLFAQLIYLCFLCLLIFLLNHFGQGVVLTVTTLA